jgi:hypothetical protein
MPATINLGHVLLLVAAIDLVAAVGFVLSSQRHAGYGRGTPQYARARTSRRAALYALVSAVVFAAAGWLTPLRDIALMGGQT